ncbi:hypothetical protein IFM89_032740 [Coptis chinensis]|uniref:GTP cyclohydrolase II n=1 Tax=Coptis chinensis TaxID=261450 RepID=A0A835LTG3_9MAGN|nr:hypothetical protein IFM89_032740 [Coptis chinensis]
MIAVDDEKEDVEGNLVMAASLINPQAMLFMVKHGSGIVYVGMKEEDLERLDLPLMSPSSKVGDPSQFTSLQLSVDLQQGEDCTQCCHLILNQKFSEDRPGHVLPLMYRNGGVLSRVGHTEASVDLVSLAGLPPISALSAIIDAEDGSIARLPFLRKMALEYGLLIVSITDLIRYRRKREKLVERIAGSIGYGQDILVRVHSECLTGDIFGSARCDCGNQLALAVQVVEQAGRGVVLYLHGHVGRGIGLGHKLMAYNLQDQGHDTVEANLELGFSADARDYGIGAQILRDIRVRTMPLMTNKPAKFTGLKGYGLAVVGRVPVISPITRNKMGHIYGSDQSSAGLPDPIANFNGPH